MRESLFAKAHKRWTIRLLVLGVLFVLGWILSERKPDSTLYNASWTAWCILVAVLVVLYPISRLMGWLTIGVALMASRLLPGGVKERRKLFLYEMAPYCGYFIWSVLALIAFEVVMGINPYPARNNLGETLSVNDKADWIRRLLGVNIGIGILLLLKSYALTTINLQVGNNNHSNNNNTTTTTTLSLLTSVLPSLVPGPAPHRKLRREDRRVYGGL